MPTFPWLPEEQNETDAQKITDTIPKEVLALTGTCHQLHPSTPQRQAAPQARTRRLCGSASAQHARKPTAAPELGGKRGGARLSLERTSPERAGAGVYLSHLLTARGRQAGTTLCFTSFLLPQPESTQPPKAAASPVTTTTNKQPPARSHCAGARQRREQRSAAGADGWRHHGALRRQSQARLSPEGFLVPFLSAFSPTPKRLTPNSEFLHTGQKGLPRERRCRKRLKRRQLLIGSKGVHSLSPARTEPA